MGAVGVAHGDGGAMVMYQRGRSAGCLSKFLDRGSFVNVLDAVFNIPGCQDLRQSLESCVRLSVHPVVWVYSSNVLEHESSHQLTPYPLSTRFSLSLWLVEN